MQLPSTRAHSKSPKSMFTLMSQEPPNKFSRTSYGPEPYRTAAEVSLDERVVAVLEGQAKFLLREVIGLTALKKIPEGLIAKRFQAELPVKVDQVLEYIKSNGLPNGFGGWGVQLKECFNGWQLIQIDDRGPDALRIFATRYDAERALLLLCERTVQPYVIGALSGEK